MSKPGPIPDIFSNNVLKIILRGLKLFYRGLENSILPHPRQKCASDVGIRMKIERMMGSPGLMWVPWAPVGAHLWLNLRKKIAISVHFALKVH